MVNTQPRNKARKSSIHSRQQAQTRKTSYNQQRGHKIEQVRLQGTKGAAIYTVTYQKTNQTWIVHEITEPIQISARQRQQGTQMVPDQKQLGTEVAVLTKP
jgi:hypothetical protein